MKKKFTVRCKHCGKEFTVIEDEVKFPIKGDKYFCSSFCSHSRVISSETKEKIGKGVKNSEKYKEGLERKHAKYLDRYELIDGHYIKKEQNKYFCGSLEEDNKNPEISKHHSPKYFNKFIPFGLDISKLYSIEFVAEYNKVKQLLYNEYVINCLSPKDIYNKYNCKEYIKNSETLLHVFKAMNFPIRGFSKAAINSWLHDKLKTPENPYQYKQQWHTTWNNKEVYLHSSYELDYAKQLDEQKIDYDTECFRIKYFNTQTNDYRCAVPDFYIPSENLIVEIKSDYTLDIQEMKDKKKAYLENGYNFKLICDFKELEI